MKNRKKHIGLIMGAVMMMSVTGTGTAFAGNQATGKTPAPAPVSAGSKDQGNKTAEKATENLYGKIKKVTKDTLTLDSASVVWEMADKKEEKTSTKNDKNDKKTAATKTDKTAKAAANADIAADLETTTMKWKLDGKEISVKIDKDTKYVMEVSAADDKTKKKDAGKKDAKGASPEKAAVNQTKVIKWEDLKEGMMLKVTIKADNSMTAREVMVVADVKEKTPDKGTDKAKTDTAKADTAKADNTKTDNTKTA